MRKNKFLALLLLAGWVGMTTSCSNESVLTADGDDLDVAAALGAKLVFSIATPSAGNIVMRDTQTDDETAIKSVNVYLFALSESVTEASSAADSDYTLLSTTTFTSDGDETFTDDGSGTVECAIDIDDEWIDKTIRALIVANDTPSDEFTVGASTIADLTGALASATVTDGDHADVLVGKPADDSSVTGFPMAAEATYTDGTETTSYVTLGSETVELSASLVRTVARVDIRNSYDGLTVDYVYISGVANQSYLFAQSSQAAPTDASYISLYPMTTYCDSDDDSIYTSWSFTSSSSEEETTTDGTASSSADSSSTESDDTEDEYEAHEGEFYLYEQESSSTNCPTVYITFSTSAGYGTVKVPFQSSTGYVNVERNHRYIIVLGGEGEETGTVTASLFDASDWDAEDGDVITVSVTKTTTSSSESE